MKKILLYCCATVGVVVVIIGIIFCSFELEKLYEKKVKYSIPLPLLEGSFEKKNINNNNKISIIYIEGLEVSEEAQQSLEYVRLACYLLSNECYEKKVFIGKLDEILLLPFAEQYEIKFKDKNKIIFGNQHTTGEIDLDSEKLFYKHFLFDKDIRKTQVVTDTEEIKKLEKHMIRRYLRK